MAGRSGRVDARPRRWDLVLASGFALAFALARAGRAAERDPYWQIRAGAENLAGVPLARPDTWTWSGVAGDWYPNSPLWNLLLAGSYAAGEFWGLFAFSALALLALLVLTALLAARLGARRLPGLLGLFAIFAGALPYLGARATLGAQLLIATAVLVGLWLSDRAAVLGTGPLAGATAVAALVLSVLGNWVHLSFLLVGPGLAVVWALLWLLRPRLAVARRTVLAVAGAVGWLLGPVLSPYGLAGGLARARAVQEVSQGLLTEWSSPFDPIQGGQWDVMAVVAVLVAAASAWWLWVEARRGADVRLLAALVLIGVPASVAGLVALRFLGIGPVTLAPVVAALATRLVDRLRQRLGRPGDPSRVRAALADYTAGRFWRVVLTVVLVALAPVALVLAGEHAVPRERAILARLPAGCRVFSAPDIAGAAVLLRPDAPVWMDGRADFFGRELLQLGVSHWTGEHPSVVPEGTGCVLLEPTRPLTTGLRARLAASGQWRLAATADGFELWLPSGS